MNALPLDRRQIAAAVAVIVVLLFVGSRLFTHRAAATAPSIPTATRAASTGAPRVIQDGVVVDVAGAVRRPGLYRLGHGARVADAIAHAGGATSKAQMELVNLAALISDGEQVVVPRRGVVAAVVGGGSATPGAARGPVHLNSATLEQLDMLPGVGPVTAQKIVDYRAEHGAFGSLDELDAIPGIGPARIEQLKGLAVP